MAKLPRSKQPKSKSYVNLHDAVIDLFTPANLILFSYIATFFQSFLTLYQTDNSMVAFLYDDLMKLVKKMMLLIFNPDVLNPCTTVSAIRKIDFDDKDNLFKVKDMSLGSRICNRKVAIRFCGKKILHTNDKLLNFIMIQLK